MREGEMLMLHDVLHLDKRLKGKHEVEGDFAMPQMPLSLQLSSTLELLNRELSEIEAALTCSSPWCQGRVSKARQTSSQPLRPHVSEPPARHRTASAQAARASMASASSLNGPKPLTRTSKGGKSLDIAPFLRGEGEVEDPLVLRAHHGGRRSPFHSSNLSARDLDKKRPQRHPP